MQKYTLIWHQFKTERWSIRSRLVQQWLLHQWMPEMISMQQLYKAQALGWLLLLQWVQPLNFVKMAFSVCSFSHRYLIFFPHDLPSSLFALFQSKRTDSNVKQYSTGYCILNGTAFNYWAVNCSSNSGPLSYVILEHGSLDSTDLREW